MDDNEKKLKKLGVSIPRILMPREGADMHKWSVVACDQYTSEPEYWRSVEEYVGSSPSTLKLIFPEVYLEDSDYEERIRSIGETMQEYIDRGILIEYEPSFFLVKRTTPDSPERWGLMAALDLEKYDYSKDSQTPIRATEGTIEERIPPRKKIREKAPIELPHILVLIDDEKKSLIEPLKNKALKENSFEKIYDFDLMKNGGHVTGYKIDRAEDIKQVASALEGLADPDMFEKKHGNRDVLLFAMGDGNHSFATAKAVWEDIKRSAPENVMNHPARWALVEIENIYDDGLIFEPIHRVVFGGAFEDFRTLLEQKCDAVFSEKNTLKEVNEVVLSGGKNGNSRKNPGEENIQYIGFLDSTRKGVFKVNDSDSTIAAGTAQSIIDELLKIKTGVTVDYIHGEETAESLGSRDGNFALILPPLDKHDFFRTVINDGALPRKTFSMGEAHEKRYYLEGRKIQGD
ncbi:MAG: DUF1015 domain-containing protein [Sediminispirochaetaceae bacterium]